METDKIFTTAQIILKGTKNLHILAESEQRLISDLILRFDQLKDIALLRKYNILLIKLIESIKVREYQAHQYIYEDGNHANIKYFLVGGEVVYTRQNQKQSQASSKQILFQKLEEKSQVNASENKKRAFQLIQDLKHNRSKPVRQLNLGEQFGSREDYNDHLVFKSKRMDTEYLQQQEQLDYQQTLSVQAQTDCIVLCISQQNYDAVFKPFLEKLNHLITVLVSTLMNIAIEDQDKYMTEYFAHYVEDNVYQQKEIVIKQGMPTEYLYFIKSGQIQIQKSITELYRYSSNQYILQKNFLNSKIYEHNVQVIEPETVITRIQRHFIYVLLKIKSLSFKQNAKQQMSLYNSQNSKQSTLLVSTQTTFTNAANSQNSQHSMVRNSSALIDHYSLLSNTSKEITTPTSIQSQVLFSFGSNSNLSQSASNQNKCMPSYSGHSMINQQFTKRVNSNQIIGIGETTSLKHINPNFNQNTNHNSNTNNINSSPSISTINKEVNDNNNLSGTTFLLKKRKIIPIKNKSFSSFLRSISANSRKSTENQLTQEVEEHQKQNIDLSNKDSIKPLIIDPCHVEVTVHQPQILTPSSLRIQKKGGHPLKKMQTVNFSISRNEHESPQGCNESLFFLDDKSQQQQQSVRSSFCIQDDIQHTNSRYNSKKSSTFLKQKVLNSQQTISEQNQNYVSQPSISLISSSNLNEMSNQFPSSKSLNSQSVILNSQKLSKNSPIPGLNFKLIQEDVHKENEGSKHYFTQRVFTPTLAQQHYYASQRKINTLGSNTNQNNLHQRQNSSQPLKRKNVIKQQNNRRSNFMKQYAENSQSQNSIFNSSYLN